ncbi:MAG: 3-deoxy-manno-octulosonate cytidylyltransferase [Proteobacteria bacterium]|nr:3-deoxy-manno-octulosonate cytidylyltransferase [Pseudomonadota bacterium]
MNFSVIIPARYASQRLPGKPLRDIVGKTMIQRVYEQALQSRAVDVVVATDDRRIHDVVTGFGGRACMTSDRHASGTDRLQEAASQLGYTEDDVVVNVQGDEPLIPPAVINQVADNLVESGAMMATLCEPIGRLSDFQDSNVVKVVTDQDDFALYFSRAPIPWPRDTPTDLTLARKHLGIYAYRVSMLNRFVTWQPAPVEQTEKLEQLRALFHGIRIHTAISDCLIPAGVDTEADLQRVIRTVASEAS